MDKTIKFPIHARLHYNADTKVVTVTDEEFAEVELTSSLGEAFLRMLGTTPQEVLEASTN